MSIRGNVAAVAAVAGVILVLSGCSSSPAAPTSDQIKASAQARADASLLEGRKTQLAILNLRQTPSQELCERLWDRKTKAEQRGLWWANWITGCTTAPSP